MSWELTISIVSAIASLSTLLGILYVAGYKLGRIELKVDTIWEEFTRRGFLGRPSGNGQGATHRREVPKQDSMG